MVFSKNRKISLLIFLSYISNMQNYPPENIFKANLIATINNSFIKYLHMSRMLKSQLVPVLHIIYHNVKSCHDKLMATKNETNSARVAALLLVQGGESANIKFV